ncbi:MAG: NAD-dependent epimerase/dehydratase family protein [Myxococcales bacterium]
MRSFVIGGAGFIGSHLVERLVERGPVTVFDNLTVGKREFLGSLLTEADRTPDNPQSHGTLARVRLVVADALDFPTLQEAMRGHNIVFHLAANPEARWGLERSRLDLEQGTLATYNALEAARLAGVQRFVLASSGTVYGNTPEPCAEQDLGNLPISLYGASKLAGEALVSAYVECFGLRACILRFGNVVGPRGTHGAILDFCNKLHAHPEYLDVLGDGRQSKPYVYVTDCTKGLLYVVDHAPEALAVYNLAPPDSTSVRRLAELCVASSPFPNARIEFGSTPQGWPGDVPTSRLIAQKLAALGFTLPHSSDEAVAKAVKDIAHQVFVSGVS